MALISLHITVLKRRISVRKLLSLMLGVSLLLGCATSTFAANKKPHKVKYKKKRIRTSK
jgi:uncharacterized lipoprotein YajG